MNQILPKTEFKGAFIDQGFLRASEVNGSWIVQDPSYPISEGSKVGLKIDYSFSWVPEAVRAAKRSQKMWVNESPRKRIGLILSWREVLLIKKEAIIQALVLETGKARWDSEIEFDRSIRLLDGLVDAYQKKSNIQALFRPYGVVACVAASTEALESAISFSVASLLNGNAVVYKSSEKATLLGQVLAETVHQSQFPKGVWNWIPGEREMGRRLCSHEDVAAVLFAGSYDVSVRIKQDTLQQHWKKLCLYTGGKNSAVVWNDVSLDAAVDSLIEASFAFCGQSAFSISRLVIHQDVFDPFLEKFHKKAKEFKIGPAQADPFMGPMIDHASVDRYMKFLGVANREGADLVMRGKALEMGEEGGFYVAPSISVSKDSSIEHVRKSIHLQAEMNSPFACLIKFSDLDQAAALVNESQFGLVAALYSENREIIERISSQLDCGILFYNRCPNRRSGTESYVPLKKSGNHRLAGLGLIDETCWIQKKEES